MDTCAVPFGLELFFYSISFAVVGLIGSFMYLMYKDTR